MRTPDKPRDTGYVERVWQQTRAAPGTPVGRYLKFLCIEWSLPPAIRFHPLLPYYDSGQVVGAWPAMVTRLDDPDGNLIGIQRTWLSPAGDDRATLPNGLPARKTLGSQGVAWLGRRDVDAIIVGENIDAALAASEYGDETWPHWVLTPVAAISATGLARFVIPRNIRRLYISEDADPEGRQATKALVRTARSSGVRVLILRVTPLDEEVA